MVNGEQCVHIKNREEQKWLNHGGGALSYHSLQINKSLLRSPGNMILYTGFSSVVLLFVKLRPKLS